MRYCLAQSGLRYAGIGKEAPHWSVFENITWLKFREPDEECCVKNGEGVVVVAFFFWDPDPLERIASE